ncbi:MAG: tRNA uridine-5-carboxymethylaminomethyl(34) synthesis GTPase MnmE [Pseudobacteriovorax sp.]|nr:tRNA uridine-5-carboxymethylaminomethyl(34) synthesis GTPase MnmE [Pseudobacteriovorax sp.]
MSNMRNLGSINLPRQSNHASENSHEHVTTIAALATAPGKGAVAVIRVSGPDAAHVLAGLLPTRDKFPIRRATLAKVYDYHQEVIDEVLVIYFHGPASFTGEDSFEIHPHGSPFIVQKLLARLYELGCTPAKPGEFTRRAFLNGKMDLTAAEGIQQLVDSNSEHQWKAARQLASGILKDHIEALRADIIGAMAYLEARIDFPDEGDVKGVELDPIVDKVKAIDSSLVALEKSYDSGKIASSGLTVALIGAPNRGKSSLMNAILKKNRAIVTDIAGTTRDYIEESCLVNGRLIRLIDTAGIRKTEETVEKIGVTASQEILKSADVVLFVSALDVEGAEDTTYLEGIDDAKIIRVVNKYDLNFHYEPKPGEFPVSCISGAGLESLKAELSARVDRSVATIGNQAFISTPRHLHAIRQARKALQGFFAGNEDGAFDEMLAFELQSAVSQLSSVIGSVDHEDLLDKIFSDFCVGK